MPNTLKKPMSGGYLGVFIFAIFMCFISLLGGGGVGVLLWGYVSWQIYKRNYVGLVTLFKLGIWLVIFCFFIGFLLLSNGSFEEKWFRYTPQGYYLTVLISGAIDLCLLIYFNNLVKHDNLNLENTLTPDISSDHKPYAKSPSSDKLSSQEVLYSKKEANDGIQYTSANKSAGNKPSIFSNYSAFVESVRDETVKVLCPKCAHKYTTKRPLHTTCPICGFLGEPIRLNDSQF